MLPPSPAVPRHLGDYSLRPRVLRIILLALPIGIISALLALLLQSLIGLLTNLVFYQRLALMLVPPGGGTLGPWLRLLAPIAGGLAVGLMARYGSEAIRGHGMPETIDAILRKGSKVQPRVAILKPLSAAIIIGTGGPFGAEGPIIMTGGAFGSVLAQLLRLTADERKALLVAGGVAGMAATFNAPLASILLAVELLLFEWRPRSYLPVVAAVATATLMRSVLMGHNALFAMPDPNLHLDARTAGFCVLTGLGGGLLAVLATQMVYFSEDSFARLPIHWMWWPAIGGLIIGIGGLFEPRALGVGYDVIADFVQGRATMSLIVGILLCKTLIWSLSLGSGTSGGVLAPLFMIGAALGALESQVFPHVAPGFWALMGLSAVLGGTMRAPLTGVVFAMELTQEWSLGLPLVITASTAFAFSALLLKRSVLTEKVVRKGFHLSREYSVDPLEVLFVREVMRGEFLTLAAEARLADIGNAFVSEDRALRQAHQRQELYPVLDREGRLSGVVTRRQMTDFALGGHPDGKATVADVMTPAPEVAFPDETLRELANRMAARGITRMPVVTREDRQCLLGLISQTDLLQGRLRDLQEERVSERLLHVHEMLPWRPRRPAPPRRGMARPRS